MTEQPMQQPMEQPEQAGGAGTILVERPDLVEAEAGDHERFSHIVPKDKIVESAVTGSPVVALCGKVWVPSRDPRKFPVCPTCKEVFESDAMHGEPSDGDLGGADGGS